MKEKYWHPSRKIHELILLIKNRSIWRLEKKRIWTAFSILVILFTLTVLITQYLSKTIKSQRKIEYDNICNEMANKISVRLFDYSLLLRSTSSFFKISDNVSRDDWHNAFVEQKVDKKFPGIQGLAYNKLIQHDHLVEHENAIRKQGFPKYFVNPKGERELYTPVIYIEPFSGKNLKAFGFDTYAEPVRRKAMELARDENLATLTTKIQLVQESDNNSQAGVIIYVPVYRRGLPINTIEERRKAIQGWASNPISMDDLMKGLFGINYSQISNQVKFKIYDSQSYNTNNLLFSNIKGKNSEPIPEYYSTTNIPFNKNKWYLHFFVYESSLAYIDKNMVLLIFAGGTIISFAMFFLYVSIVSMHFRAASLAEKLTSELRISEEKYSKLFLNEVYAIGIFDFETNRFIDVNNKYCELYGYSREEFLSTITLYDITNQPEETEHSVQYASDNKSIFIPLRYHKKKDGTVFPVEIVGELYWLGNKKVYYSTVHEITERIAAEKKIVKWQTIFNKSKLGLAISSSNGKEIELVNEECARMHGYEVDELIGMPISNIFHERDKGDFENSLKIISEKQHFVWETNHIRKDGSIFPVSIDASIIEGDDSNSTFRIVSIQDITSRKVIENKLRESELMYKEIFNFSPIPMAFIDKNMNILEINSAFIDVFGYTLEEIPTITDWSLKVYPDIEDRKEVFKKAELEFNRIAKENTTFIPIELRIFCKNGKTKIVLASFTVLKGYHDNDRLVAFTDITELKETETQLQSYREHLEELVAQKTGELANVNQRLVLEINKQREYEQLLQNSLNQEKELSLMKSNFIATASHEFRTPLTSILSSAELLYKYGHKWDENKRYEHVERARSKVAYLTKLLDEVLLISKAEAGKIICNRTNTDLNQLIKGCLVDFESAFKLSHTIQLTYACNYEIYKVDPNLIKTIISNLISNAIKFSPNGGQIRIICSEQQNELYIEISDEGIGFEKDETNKIFNAFYRANNVQAIPGTGLGLAISEHSAKQHNGKIFAKSELGQGSTFTLVIPVID